MQETSSVLGILDQERSLISLKGRIKCSTSGQVGEFLLEPQRRRDFYLKYEINSNHNPNPKFVMIRRFNYYCQNKNPIISIKSNKHYKSS